MRGLYPYRFTGHHGGFNWIPFMPQFEKTSFSSLWNFVESGMIYFPMGFMLAYFFPASRRARVLSIALAVITALAVETAQGWIIGRYSDVTEALGALMGNLAGIMAVSRGWKTFRYYLVEESDSAPEGEA
jgi:glycopeptide antibiotics resistance protein